MTLLFQDEKSNMHEIPADGATSCRCKPGKHVLFLDDQIGIRCKICDYIEMEIRDVFPAMVSKS
jgi:DNA repair and recombination RAD54-like protein